jgi:plasmid stabilization system protein ParE
VTYRVRFSAEARSDIERLYQFLADHDIQAAESALETLGRAWDLLSHFLRELVIPFGHTGYVALFEIESDTTVTLLALRHQREDDYH